MDGSGDNYFLGRWGDRPLPPRALLDSIISHLDGLLNTRQGSCLACPTYGLDNPLALLAGLPNTAGILARQLRQAIAAFEPRLQRVHVEHAAAADGVTVHFTVTAQCVEAGGAHGVCLHARMNAAGRVDVTL